MEAIAGILGALISAGVQAQAINEQKNLGYSNLYETKRENRSREKLAESSRTDAYGNMVYYDPLARAWKIKSTPTTKGILDAEQAEQTKSLTTDAKRNRAAVERKDRRSREAADLFEQALTDYKYRPVKSEADYIGDSTRQALLSRRAGSAKAAADVNQALIRQGNGSNIESVFNAARDADANEFEQTLLGAKRQGESDFLNFEGAKNAKDQQQLEFLRGIADDTSDSPIRFGNENAELGGKQSDALAQLLQVLSQSSANRQGAMNTLIDVVGKTPDLSGLASAFSGLGRAAGGGGKSSLFPSGSGGGEINGDWWAQMGKMGYLTPSKNSASAFMNEF